MDNTSRMALISERMEELYRFIRLLNEPTTRISRIDVDIVLEKMRIIYESLSRLDFKPEFAPFTREEEVPTFDALLQDEHLDVSLPVVKSKEPVAISEEPVSEVFEPIPETVKEVIALQNEAKTEETPQTLADLFSSPATNQVHTTSKTIVEKIAEQKPVEIMADKMSKNKIASLIKAIGINEKFHFINELFDGNMKAYTTAIEAIDQCESLETATASLYSLREQHQWDSTNEAYGQLLDLIERKFI
jgi:hypothetical protein